MDPEGTIVISTTGKVILGAVGGGAVVLAGVVIALAAVGGGVGGGTTASASAIALSTVASVAARAHYDRLQRVRRHEQDLY